MPLYSFFAKNLKGEEKKGLIEAKDEKDLFRILREKGLILVSWKKEKEKEEKFPSFFSLFGKISLKEKLFFTRNLKVMIESGVSLPKALKILSLQTKNKKFKKIILEIRDKIIRGESFSKALSYFPNIFPNIFISMIKVGEETGNLESSLENLSTQMERNYNLRSKVKGALIYPAIVISAMLGIGMLMLIVVVPKLAETFEELNIELPFTTRLVINAGSFLARFWFILPLFILFVLFMIKRPKKRKKGFLDKISLKLPVFSKIIKELNTAYTARTLSVLVASGVSLVSSLRITSEIVTNFYFKEVLLKVAKQVEKGEKISDSFEKFNENEIYPQVFVQMLRVGEETGETSKILEKLADFFEEEVTNMTKNLASIIEPVLMLMIGATIGFFAVSMIQPLYSMMEAL